MTAAARLEALVGPNLAAAILDALREEIAAASAPHSEPASRWLTVEQTAEYLGTTPKAIRRRIDRGRLRVVRDGRRLYVTARRSTRHSPRRGVCSRDHTESPRTATRPGARPQEVALP